MFVYFDGVYKNSTVWLNGHLLGNRPNGFIAFEYELTGYLDFKRYQHPYREKVDHSEFADSRWYTGSGIYRNVYLIAKEPVHIAKWGVQFSTPVVSKSTATANVSVNVINQHKKDDAVTAVCTLKDKKGKVIATKSSQVFIKKSDSAFARLSLIIPKPVLWAVENPALYTLSVSLLAKGEAD